MLYPASMNNLASRLQYSGSLSNIVDSDQTVPGEQSDQGVHCLHKKYYQISTYCTK